MDIDPLYEFDAPKIYDFGDTENTDKDLDSWFGKKTM
jgi:hypothetical protein